MAHSKTMLKIIRYKQHNRRISSILKSITKCTGVFYFNLGSKYNNWTKHELEEQMRMNGKMILNLREKMANPIKN